MGLGTRQRAPVGLAYAEAQNAFVCGLLLSAGVRPETGGAAP